MIDLYWTLDGDLAIGEDGDLRDTSFDSLRSTWQEMRTRIRSSLRDWAIHPRLGANLERLLGEPNNRETAEEGKARIVNALALEGFLPRSAIEVRYLPVSVTELVFAIRVMVPTESGSRYLEAQVLYDTRENQVAVL